MTMMLYTMPIAMKQSIGDKIRTLRAICDFSREELAERAGMSRNGLGLIETGTTKAPALANIKALAAALGIRWEVLADENASLADVVAEQQAHYGEKKKDTASSHHAARKQESRVDGMEGIKRRAG